MEKSMNTIGLYIRRIGDKRTFATQEKLLINAARRLGYDSYIATLTMCRLSALTTSFTPVGIEMSEDIRAGIIDAALVRFIFLVDDDLYKVSDLESTYRKMFTTVLQSVLRMRHGSLIATWHI
jgi:hypothetical protein